MVRKPDEAEATYSLPVSDLTVTVSQTLGPTKQTAELFGQRDFK